MKTLLIVPLLLLKAVVVFADTSSPILNTEGIAGDMDKGRRSPALSVGTTITSSGTKILVDAVELNQEFTKYPIRFDFFINRKLFSSQLRSPELPGPIGIDVSSAVTAPPFNYAVIATLLHPNRTYTTVLQGAVFKSNLVTTFGCNLEITGTDENLGIEQYSVEAANTAQSGNNAFTLAFEGDEINSDKTALISTAVTVDGEGASGTISVNRSGEISNLKSTGTVTYVDGKLSALSLTATEDSNTKLVCG